MRARPLYDVVAVLARLGVGLVFMAHGWQKIEEGITATGRSFDDLDVPLPTAAAVYTAFVELLGGAALIAGLALPVAGVLLFADMAGAFVFVHADRGLFLVDGAKVENGYELVLVLGVASLLFAAGGGGRLTVDHWIGAKRQRRRRPRVQEEDDAASFVKSLRTAETEPVPASRPLAEAPPAAPAAPADPGGAEPGSDDDLLVGGPRKTKRSFRVRGAKAPAVTAPDEGDDAT
jgi:putative oxidoreductase